MARTEAQKRAEKSYDKTKREVRGQVWCIIAYPDSLPDNWNDYLDEMHVEIIVSPLHDKDVNANGEIKKPHYHIVFIFSSVKSFSQVSEIAEELNAARPMKQDSKRGIVRYLCHLDNPSKAQYDEADIMCFGGADYRSIVSCASDKYELIAELLDWIDDNPSVHHWAFSAVMRWTRTNNDKWFRGLCDNCGWVVKEYLQSCSWEYEQRARLEKQLEENSL